MCLVYPSGGGSFEVKDGSSYLAVSLVNRTCACGQWQISGIPFKHAIRAILQNDEAPEAYVAHWFSVSTYQQAYSCSISFVPDPDQWPPFDLPEIQPPRMKRGIGRPSRNRRREEGEKRKEKRSTTVQCGKCKAYGHNAKTCKGGLTAKEASARDGVRIEQRSRKKKKDAGASTLGGHSCEQMVDGESSHVALQ